MNALQYCLQLFNLLRLYLGQYVYAIGLIDIDYESSVTVVYETATGFKDFEIDIPLIGDNAVQTIKIDQENGTCIAP